MLEFAALYSLCLLKIMYTLMTFSLIYILKIVFPVYISSICILSFRNGNSKSEDMIFKYHVKFCLHIIHIYFSVTLLTPFRIFFSFSIFLIRNDTVKTNASERLLIFFNATFQIADNRFRKKNYLHLKCSVNEICFKLPNK